MGITPEVGSELSLGAGYLGFCELHSSGETVGITPEVGSVVESWCWVARLL